MKSDERQELRELRDRIIKLETLIETEFKHLHDELSTTCNSIKTLNEEYSKLIERQHQLELTQKEAEDKYKRSLTYWRIATAVAAPAVTTIVVFIIHTIFGF